MVAPTTALIAAQEFVPLFEALTDHPPYQWQQRLFDLLLLGEIPADIGLPTGSGKTSIMAVWLVALAAGAPVPRRLVWVVDRRVVVDQATKEADEIWSRLAASSGEGLESMRRALAGLTLDRENSDDLVAISTLRGEREDNREWSRDPARPAIIVGTVDMIGSRLLFSGYGDGRSRRASHAGLLGHDALLVNDEAHLTPAFASLLGKLADIFRNSEHDDPLRDRRLRIMRLSATHQAGHKCWPQSLHEDQEQSAFRKIFEAPKHLEIVSARKLLELATAPGPARTLIFVRQPEQVREIAAALKRAVGNDSRIICLTGTMRGFERDRLVLHRVFKEFEERRKPDESCWLVATSAAEVGIDISSDRLITDLETADHLIQRFGRLNRFAETEGQAYLLVSDAELKDAEQKDDKQKYPRKCKTLAYFRDLLAIANDISTARLFASPPPPDACSETPLEAQLHKWLVDVWSQTTLAAHPARPAVEPWLHGKQDNYPETYVAWREEVSDLTKDGIDSDDLEVLLRKYPVLAHERLREPTYQLQEKLAQLARKDPGARVLCQKPDGSVAVLTLENIADKRQAGQLAYCQVILAPGCGSLKQGMFSPECQDAKDSNAALLDYDLSVCELDKASGEVRYNGKRACYRATQAEDGKWWLQRLGNVATDKRVPPVALNDLKPATLRQFADEAGWRLLLPPLQAGAVEGEDEANTAVLLYFKQIARKMTRSGVVSLEEHLKAVAAKAAEVGEKLGLEDDIRRALVVAGQLHDLGKQERIWQRAARNPDNAPALAKSALPMRPQVLGGFRHELASLRYAERQLDSESAEIRDLALHLIAAHHGHARPCFEKKAYDRAHRKESERLALEAAQRFGRLQRRYGAWGLAYLEAVFKSADALASADSEEYA